MNKKVLSIFIVMVLILSLAGCAKEEVETGNATDAGKSQEAEKPQEVVELKFLTHQIGESQDSEQIQAYVDKFNEENQGEAKVIIEGIPEYTNYMNKIKTNVAAGVPMDLYYVMEDIKSPEFWGSGYMADLTPYIDDEFKSYKTKEQWEVCTIDGKVVAVPYYSLLTGIFYNKEHFADAGVDKVPETWDEFFYGLPKASRERIYTIFRVHFRNRMDINAAIFSFCCGY